MPFSIIKHTYIAHLLINPETNKGKTPVPQNSFLFIISLITLKTYTSILTLSNFWYHAYKIICPCLQNKVQLQQWLPHSYQIIFSGTYFWYQQTPGGRWELDLERLVGEEAYWSSTPSIWSLFSLICVTVHSVQFCFSFTCGNFFAILSFKSSND